MSTHIFIVVMPGIGQHDNEFSVKFEKDLQKFSKNTPLETNYEIIPCLPFNTTQVDHNQQSLIERLDAANNLKGPLALRKVVMQAFGDAVTFEHKAHDISSSYQRIHGYLKGFFQELYKKMQTVNHSQLVVVTSSMASHILSTYIWDADNNKGIFKKIPADQSCNLKNLDYLASIGSNIPLFVSGLSENQTMAFEKRNEHFSWDNFYDKNDLLGWPLKQLSPSYEKIVTDYEINTGLSVGSHVKYWDDNNFTKPFTQKLLSLLQ